MAGQQHRALGYRDKGRTRYFLRKDFKDLSEMDWSGLIPEAEREATLVVLDDHVSSTKRVQDLLAQGFVHLWYDDNFNYNYGAGDTYSFNLVCSPPPDGASNATFRATLGDPLETISLEQHKAKLDYIVEHVDTYFEF